MDSIDNVLYRLSKSKFRSSFHLNKKLINYIDEKGMNIIEKHAYDLIKKAVYEYDDKKDGKQTPMKNHPVFIAQHATACCCRGCIEKWYHIPKFKDLTEEELKYFQSLVMKWIKVKYENEKRNYFTIE